ncbi:MAG: Holliday junction branch migration DNA helicase RuvB [Pseudomonadota bacterium]|jgi:Holliday junction DNA helicase RuvB|nr:Holliday junction branch migration DNA helicase RuvB [Alphaproteobacteria bacterium]
MDERLINPEAFLEDDWEATIRPTILNEFVGQQALRENLIVYINAAKKRGEALDHVLLHGPPGLGKTTLAQIIAREMGVAFKTTSGPIISKAGDLAAILTNLQPNDVLFIDEIHRLNPAVEETLYTAIEDFKLDIMIGEGPAARSIRLDLPKFTLIGATTRSGLLTQPLRERFSIPLRLQFYTHVELSQIILRAANILDVKINAEAALEIASRCRGTPRIAGRLLRRIRDFAIMYANNSIDLKIANQSLMRLEIDAQGLDQQDLRYLKAMAEHYNGGPVGVETLSAYLAEQKDTIEEVVEPYLIQLGYIQRTSRGRMLTASAYQHLGLPCP